MIDMTGHSGRDKVIEGKGRMSDAIIDDRELSARERFLKSMADGVIAGGRLPAAEPAAGAERLSLREYLVKLKKERPEMFVVSKQEMLGQWVQDRPVIGELMGGD